MDALSTVTVPEVGVTRPMIMAMVVVLPAPLPPSSPVTEPFCNVNEIPATAMPVLYILTRWSTATAGSDMTRHLNNGSLIVDFLYRTSGAAQYVMQVRRTRATWNELTDLLIDCSAASMATKKVCDVRACK